MLNTKSTKTGKFIPTLYSVSASLGRAGLKEAPKFSGESEATATLLRSRSAAFLPHSFSAAAAAVRQFFLGAKRGCQTYVAYPRERRKNPYRRTEDTAPLPDYTAKNGGRFPGAEMAARICRRAKRRVARVKRRVKRRSGTIEIGAVASATLPGARLRDERERFAFISRNSPEIYPLFQPRARARQRSSVVFCYAS